MNPQTPNNEDSPALIVPSVLVKSFALVFSFLILTPLALALTLYTLVSISSSQHEAQVLAAHTQSVPILASNDASIPSVEGSAQSKDAREYIIKNYLEKYNSPLYPHAKSIVQTADRYELDFRLITAIAQQESNLCKVIPEGTYNCWGWGIHSRGTLGFSSFEEGINIVSEGLKKEYIDKGYVSPEEIMTKYTPLSDGSWAHGVTTFMAEME